MFVSHTAELRVLPEHRSFVAAVEAAITRAGDVAVDMAYFTAHDIPPAQLDLDMVAKADVYVLLAGFCYGTPVRDRPELSYTEHEFEAAGQRGLPRLVFLISEQAEGPAGLFRDPQYGARQEGFRERLRNSGLTVTEVHSPDHAETAVFDALIKLPRAESARAPVGRVWGVPARPIRFTGRDEQLAGLRMALTDEKPTVVQAMHGMGGVGKTTLALEYAHRNADKYDIAWWIPAEQPELIPGRLAVLAQALDLAGDTDNTQAAVARLLGDLRGQDRWLLVFDNAEDPTALAPFLPGGDGHVVITSRNPHWYGIATTVEIGEFTRAESVALIRTRLAHFTDAEADQVAKAIGDLPLAVDQAAALLIDTGWEVSAYLDLLGHSAERLLNQRNDAAGYRLSVAASWQVTFDELTNTAPAAVQLLSLAAWLAPERIPLRIFTDHAAMLPQPLADAAGDPLAWTQVLAVLRRRAAARVGSDSLLLHRIPSALLRTHSPVAAPDDGWAALAIKLLRTAVPTDPWDRPASWPAWQALLAHVLTATTYAPDTVADEADWLTDRLATYLHTRGEPRAARPHHQRAFDRCRARRGEDHPETLLYANRLALDLHALGEYEQSCRLNQEILERRGRVLGPDDRYTLGSASNLARDLRALGEYQQARDLDQDTLNNRRRALGEDDRDTLLSASNLGRDLHALGEFRLAYDLDQETLDRRRRVLGEDHPHTLTSIENLARDLWDLGEHQQAHDVDRDALDRRRRVLGEDHPATLHSANNLARDLYALGEFQLAHDLDQDTLNRRRRVLGEDHPHTLTSIDNLAHDLDALKQP